jgi:hypothetical protein
MATRTDWVEQSHTEFHTQVNATEAYINDPTAGRLKVFGYDTDSPIYTWITVTFVIGLNAFNDAYAAWFDTDKRTHISQVDIELTEKALKKLYRQLYALFKGNMIVTDHDLAMMKMPTRPSGGRTPSPAPTTLVDAEFELTHPTVVLVHYRNAGTKSKAKPPGVHGVEAIYTVSAEPVTDRRELTISVFDTHSPFKLSFETEQRGLHVYIAFRWENTTGEKGDWSKIFETVIP